MASVSRAIQTSHGVRYRVRWRDENRKDREQWFATKAAADAKKREVERDEYDGISLDPRPGRQALNDYFDAWLERRIVKGRPLAESTKYEYRKLWRRHVSNTLGRSPIRSVSIQAVNEWHDTVTREHGASQAAKAYRTLRAVMKTAEADQIIRQCPCRIRGGGQEHVEERPLVETSLVLQLADAIDERYRCVVLLAAFAGLRTGESLGLRRRHVNVLHGTLDVVGQSQEIPKQRFVDRTKSDAGRRTLKIKSLLPELETHLDKFVGADADALLFTNPFGTPLKRSELSDSWLAALATVDAPAGLRLHDLRHHAATQAARSGLTLKELMARIGHATPHAALRYQHAALERDEVADDYMSKLMQSARGGAG